MQIERIEMIALLFYAKYETDNVTNIITEWEQAVYNYLAEGSNEVDFKELEINVLGDKILMKEITRGGLSLLPLMVVGMILLVVFLFICVMISTPVNRLKLSMNKPLLVIGIILSPILALTTTFGLVGFLDIPIYPIHFVIPFLVIAIGVDDAFLILHSWNRKYKEMQYYSTTKKIDIMPTIIGKVLKDIGPSITITSMTNYLAFIIGSFFSTPAIQSFCYTASCSIFLDFLFQLSLFTSILVIAEKNEILCGNVKSIELMEVEPERGLCIIKNEKTKQKEEVITNLLKQYCYLLTSNIFRCIVFVSVAIYLGFSIWGIFQIQPLINSQQIIPSDSLLQRTDRLFEKYTWKEYEILNVYVNNPPDISTSNGLQELNKIISKFETMPQAIGSASTLFFLDQYKVYIGFLNVLTFFGGFQIGTDTNSLPQFLKDFPVYNNAVKWHKENDSIVVDKFSFMTAYCNSTTWSDRANLMEKWREVADNLTQYNVSIYSENAPIFEGILNLKYNTVQSTLISLIAMIIVCIFFVSSMPCVLLSTVFGITSISVGLFGFLTILDLKLDLISNIAILVCIGFSVDYTAHFCYHYQKATDVISQNSEETHRQVLINRIHHAFKSVGWPMIQAGLSTVICMCPVIFTTDHIPQVFAKIIFLVVGLGMIHGLLILPMIMAVFPDSWYIKKIKPSDALTNDPQKVSKSQYLLQFDYDESLKSAVISNNKFEANSCSDNIPDILKTPTADPSISENDQEDSGVASDHS
uniref:SSD domain-containing protein n=1 Tax=Rhabditophanes sp. KR3021 TaxID=114890 RepID=A0AC35UE77_9BILA